MLALWPQTAGVRLKRRTPFHRDRGVVMKPTRMNPLWHCAVFVALLCPSAEVASAQTKISIIHAVVGPSETPLWIAHEQGLFAKQGIDAQILLQETAGVARRITGDIQFGVIGIPATIAAVVEGRDLKILADQLRARDHSPGGSSGCQDAGRPSRQAIWRLRNRHGLLDPRDAGAGAPRPRSQTRPNHLC